MYHGEVNVAQEELNSFLAVAEDLQVKGLTQNNPDHNPTTVRDHKTESKPKVYTTTKEPDPPSTFITPKRSRPVVPLPRATPTPQATAVDDDFLEVIPTVKQEPQPIPAPQPVANVAYSHSGYGEVSEGSQVASMEESYAEEGYDDYGGYEGEGMGYDQTLGTGHVDEATKGRHCFTIFIL